MYGLKDIHIHKIQSVFSNYENIEHVILYGSRAKGNYRDNSDIDLSLIGQSINLSLLQQIENDLDDLLLPYKIDLSIFHKIDNINLIEHINRIGIVFYKNK